MEVVASLSQGRTAAAQCGLFTYKSVPVIFEPPCISYSFTAVFFSLGDFKVDKCVLLITWSEQYYQNIMASLSIYCLSKRMGKFGDTNMELILCCDKYCCIVFGRMCR